MTSGLAEIAAPEFDLGLTLGCGQVFHWRRHGDGWLGMIGDAPCYAEQRGRTLLVPRGMEEIAAEYFALDHPLKKMSATFPGDPAMTAASEACRGLRLVRQPHWECIATFITSAQKAVPHIAQISHTLRERYGRAATWNGERLFAYPEPAALAALDEKDLRACALGAPREEPAAHRAHDRRRRSEPRSRRAARRRRGRARIAASRRRRPEGRGVRAAVWIRTARGVSD